MKLNGVKPTTSIETLKLLIFRITGMHLEDQPRCMSETLQDFRHVGAYSLAEGCMLRLHPQVRSGF